MFRILVRHLLKNPLITSINIIGLTLGITMFAGIYLFVENERSYDQHFSRYETIFRIVQQRSFEGVNTGMAYTPLALSPALHNITQIQAQTRLLRESGSVLVYGERAFEEPQFCFADSTVKDVFDFDFITGNPTDAFVPDGLVITETIASKYFGKENPIGKTVTYRNWGMETPLRVTAVIRDFPQETHFHFQLFGLFESPYNLWNGMHGRDWYHSGAWTYVVARHAQDASSISEQVNREAQRHLPPELKKGTVFNLQPLERIHLHSDLASEIEVNGNYSTVVIFAAIGIAILLLACINYINLSTSRSIERTKEIGIRKVLGALRRDLLVLHFAETFLVTTCGVVVSIALVPLLLPLLHSLTGKNLETHTHDWLFILAGTGAVTAVLSGIYPALYLSKLKPALILKMSKNFGTNDRGMLRRFFVTVQFATTAALLIVVFTIAAQMQFIHNKNLGFDTREVLYLDGYNYESAKNLKRTLSTLPEISEITSGWAIPQSHYSFSKNLLRTNPAEEHQRLEVYYATVDEDYLGFFEIEVIIGRNFSDSFKEDSVNSVIVNETFVGDAGWASHEVIGKEVEIFDMLGRSAGKRQVVGIVRDFHFESMHQSIKPLVLGYTNRGGSIAFRMNSTAPMETVEKIKRLITPYSDGSVGDVYYLDENLNNIYEREKRFAATMKVLTLVAVFISAIGIFGLASYNAVRRSKEIAIRKVMGASVSGLFMKFAAEYTNLVLIAFLISAPIAYYVSNQWLQGFTYRVQQSAGYYLLAIMTSLFVCMITVGFYSIKTARINPGKVLKEE